jgi:serine/threonine kinase 16
LISDEGIPLLTDFGSVSAARVEVANRQQALTLEDEASVKTSAAYRAPELTSVQHPSSVDERVDVWALGCSLYCLAFGRSPFETRKEGISRLAILNSKYVYPAARRVRECTYSAGFCDLIDSMLRVDHRARPYASEVADAADLLLAQILKK